MKSLLLTIVLLVIGVAANAQTFCEHQYKELQGYALAAKYESLPEDQRAHFLASLTTEQNLGLMASRSGHQLGAAINNSLGGNYRDSMTDVFNRKLAEFKTKCGFMLR
jgi:subtilase family serine protease